jgi:hypothetical protein
MRGNETRRVSVCFGFALAVKRKELSNVLLLYAEGKNSNVARQI